MRTKDELAHLKAQAVSLRRAGKSRREIQEALGFTGNSTLNQLLRGEPLPPGRAGPGYAQTRRRAAEGIRRYWAAEHPAREAARAAVSTAAAAQVGELTDREITIAGAIAYWCEGGKNKPYRRTDRIIFTNSDPDLISFFLRFLDTVGVPPSDLAFQLQIHETADVQSAERFWLSLTEARPEQFHTSLKRPNPTTTRKNTGDDYHGCLRVAVKRSDQLYRKIEGWASAAMATAEALNDQP